MFSMRRSFRSGPSKGKAAYNRIVFGAQKYGLRHEILNHRHQVSHTSQRKSDNFQSSPDEGAGLAVVGSGGPFAPGQTRKGEQTPARADKAHRIYSAVRHAKQTPNRPDRGP
ncbi:hypothetical protein EVAR_81302_1 [Eumeta japonica]|uniref:Uncharacterized protein n=1 Tax=Eumeta variegata TaxID=151549 RepID=A0A4C1VZC0_EUMVA|nr:hypothetical protein EVAR_81302_1 [Eumeta japonica]